MPKSDPAKLVKMTISLPFGIGSAEWVSDPTERSAAWHLYVELMTRIAIGPSSPDAGLIREALDSLHIIFAITREILKNAGPDVGIEDDSLGGLALAVLNKGFRPFLSKWHPLLSDWEAVPHAGKSQHQHESTWPDRPLFLEEFSAFQEQISIYLTALAIIAGPR